MGIFQKKRLRLHGASLRATVWRVTPPRPLSPALDLRHASDREAAWSSSAMGTAGESEWHWFSTS